MSDLTKDAKMGRREGSEEGIPSSPEIEVKQSPSPTEEGKGRSESLGNRRRTNPHPNPLPQGEGADTALSAQYAEPRTYNSAQHSALGTQNSNGWRGFFGVEGIDALIPNGISYEFQVMVQGDTGVGKSVLASQFIYEGLLVGDKCVYVACDEPPSVMRENMADLRLGTSAYEEIGQLVFIDAYSRERSGEKYYIPDPSNFDEFFLYQKRILDDMGDVHIRLVVDSISTIFSTASTIDILEFNSHRLRYLRSKRVLTLDNYVGGVIDERAIYGLFHAYPMIIKMQFRLVNGILQRYLQLGKLKSGQFASMVHLFTIDPRTGIVIQKTT